MTQPIMSFKLENKRFQEHVRKYVKVLDGNTRAALLDIGQEILLRIILKNPVYQGDAYPGGRSRSGWTVAGRLLDVPVPATKAAITTAELGDARITQNGLQFTLVLTNGVSYTIHLENGTSTQAPFGMVRISMRELETEWSGKDQLPTKISRMYAETWNNLGLAPGTLLRAGDIARATGLSPGGNVGAVSR